MCLASQTVENDARDPHGGRTELTPEGCLGLPYTPQQMRKSGSHQKKQTDQEIYVIK